MLSDEFINAGKTPDPRVYHVHIYYEPGAESDRAAKGLAQALAQRFPGHVEAVKEYDTPGGPHAQSNVAVHFRREGFGEIVSWLQLNAADLSILVHPKAGDVIKDHLDYGLWLGPKREGLLNDAYFARKKAERKGPSPKL